MLCFPHTLLRTNVTLHVIRRKETTPVSYQTNEPMCTLTLTHYATTSKKQLRSLSRRENFNLLKEITEGVLGQVLGCDVREHLLGQRVVKGDLVLLTSSCTKKYRRAICLVLALNMLFPATLSAPVLSLRMGTCGESLSPNSVRKLDR